MDYEPFAFFAGVSIWPSELLRIVGSALAVGWAFRIMGELRHEVIHTKRRISVVRAKDADSSDIRLGSVIGDKRKRALARRPVPVPGRLVRSWRRLLQFAGYPAATGRPESIVEAWDELELWSRTRNRLSRTASHLLLFVPFSFCIFSLWEDRPFTPVRGELAAQFDRGALVLGVLTMQWLIFLVLDSGMIVSRFLRRLCIPDLIPIAPRKSTKTAREQKLKDEHVWARRRIEVAAQLTERIGTFLYYPSFVVLLMVLARLPAFDDWTWPTPLVVVIGMSLVVLGVCYVLSWSVAHWLRREVLADITAEKRALAYDDSSGKALDDLAKEVSSIRRGAFAPFWEHPLLRAILIPFAGLGSFSVLELLR